MISAHLESLDLLRKTRGTTLELVRDLNQAQSDYVPAPGKWSVGEVLDHLLLAEKLYRDSIATLIELERAGRRPVISKSFSEIDTSIAYLPKSVLPFLDVPFTLLNIVVPPVVREAMATFRGLPAQTPRVAVPSAGKRVGDLRNALRASIEGTAQLLKDNPSIDYRKLRYRHPLLGDNNVAQLIRIVSFHEQRHHQQIRDILSSRTFPQAA
jgi:hypothetical protein